MINIKWMNCEAITEGSPSRYARSYFKRIEESEALYKISSKQKPWVKKDSIGVSSIGPVKDFYKKLGSEINNLSGLTKNWLKEADRILPYGRFCEWDMDRNIKSEISSDYWGGKGKNMNLKEMYENLHKSDRTRIAESVKEILKPVNGFGKEIKRLENLEEIYKLDKTILRLKKENADLSSKLEEKKNDSQCDEISHKKETIFTPLIHAVDNMPDQDIITGQWRSIKRRSNTSTEFHLDGYTSPVKMSGDTDSMLGDIGYKAQFGLNSLRLEYYSSKEGWQTDVIVEKKYIERFSNYKIMGGSFLIDRENNTMTMCQQCNGVMDKNPVLTAYFQDNVI